MLTFAFMHYPYLVCLLFGMPSLHLFTFLMFLSLVSVLFCWNGKYIAVLAYIIVTSLHRLPLTLIATMLFVRTVITVSVSITAVHFWDTVVVWATSKAKLMPHTSNTTSWDRQVEEECKSEKEERRYGGREVSVYCGHSFFAKIENWHWHHDVNIHFLKFWGLISTWNLMNSISNCQLFCLHKGDDSYSVFVWSAPRASVATCRQKLKIEFSKC